MLKFRSKVLVGALAALIGATSILPAGAAPLLVRPAIAENGGATVIQVRDHGPRRGYYVRRGHHYYNGHRGYRAYHRGYRRHNGFWFPPAAFIGGAIIGGAIASQARPVGNAHVQWCYNHYRSYRASDNTYQPYSGPRRQCVSPY